MNAKAKTTLSLAEEVQAALKLETKRTKLHLTHKQYYQLNEYVKTNYAASGLTDVEFTKQAIEALGFELTQHHVAASREVFDLPSNYVAAAQASEVLLVHRVLALEKAMASALARLSKLEADLGVNS